MIGDHVRELLEPPQRQPGEDGALVRDDGRQDHVVSAHPVRRDEQQLVVADRVEVPDLAGVEQRQLGRHPTSLSAQQEGQRRQAG